MDAWQSEVFRHELEVIGKLLYKNPDRHAKQLFARGRDRKLDLMREVPGEQKIPFNNTLPGLVSR